MSTINTVFRDEFIPFEIDGIVYEDDVRGDAPTNIEFEFNNASMGIDMSGRFAKHEIIGGSTVRQKIGEDPINVSVEGVCFEATSKDIIRLRDAKHGTIYSTQLPGGSLEVQFASASVDPMEEGGAVDLSEGQFLYSFSLNCIEVLTGDTPSADVVEEDTTETTDTTDTDDDTATAENPNAGDEIDTDTGGRQVGEFVIDPDTGEIVPREEVDLDE